MAQEAVPQLFGTTDTDDMLRERGRFQKSTIALSLGAALLALVVVGWQATPAALALAALALCVHRDVVSWRTATVPLAFVVGLGLWTHIVVQVTHVVALSHDAQGLILNVAVISWAVATLEASRRVRLHLDSTSLLDGAVAGGLGLGVCLLDSHGRLQRINPAAEKILGRSQADLAGHNLLEIMGAINSDLAGRVVASGGENARSASSVVRQEEIEYPARNGSSRRLDCLWSPVVRRGRVRGIVLGFRDITRDGDLQVALEGHETSYRGLVDAVPEALIVTDAEGNITGANTRAADLFGWPRSHLLSRPLATVVSADSEEEMQTILAHARSESDATTRTVAGKRQDGSSLPLEMQIQRLPAGTASHAALAIFFRQTKEVPEDTGASARVQAAVSAALARATGLPDAVSGFLAAVGEQGDWDLGIAQAHRPESETLSQYAIWTREGAVRSDLQHLLESYSIFRGADLAGRAWETGECLWVSDTREIEGHRRLSALAASGYFSALAVPVRMRGQVVMVMEWYSASPRAPQTELIRQLASLAAYLGQSIDRARAEQELIRQALHDALTGLPNRTLLQRRLQGSIGVSTESNAKLALLLLDLDRFKEINDTLGHSAGDALLQEVSQRLQRILRKSDTVARLGGDEFAVLLPGTDAVGAAQVAGSIITALREPYALCGRAIDVGTSVGIALYPEDGVDASTLMQHADVAMYVAKRSQSGYGRYSPDTDRHSPERLSLAAELRQAIECGRLCLYYQPKLNLESGAMESVEALVRWPHPTRGLLTPNEFIPVAEDAGLTRIMTSWVLQEAIRQHRRWKDAGLGLHVAVNLFPQTLHDNLMVEDVRRLLTQYKVDPTALTLEITETAVMQEPEAALETLRQLRAFGVRISIDDFGTGYSSLLYLKRLPVDELKIDKSFILDMASQDDDALIARTVVDLGHNLGLKVIAEGVQSQDAWNLLQSIGCDFLQGFYVSEPLPADELARWMARESLVPLDFISRTA